MSAPADMRTGEVFDAFDIDLVMKVAKHTLFSTRTFVILSATL